LVYWLLKRSQKKVARTQLTKGGKTTKTDKWKLIYYEAYLNKNDALGRERFLKSGSGRRFLKNQLRHYLKNFIIEKSPILS